MDQLKKILLASQSKQRIDIIRMFIKSFEHISPDIDEAFNDRFDIITNSMSISKAKAESAIDKHKDNIIIASDTVVLYLNKILGKPKNQIEAREFLKLLSGNTHEVLSSFCIIETGTYKKVVDYTLSKVTFSAISDSEIDYYIKSGEWVERAGAYAIQGLASSFVSKIKGDYMGIVGLPINKIANYLLDYFEYNLLKECEDV